MCDALLEIGQLRVGAHAQNLRVGAHCVVPARRMELGAADGLNGTAIDHRSNTLTEETIAIPVCLRVT